MVGVLSEKNLNEEEKKTLQKAILNSIKNEVDSDNPNKFKIDSVSLLIDMYDRADETTVGVRGRGYAKAVIVLTGLGIVTTIIYLAFTGALIRIIG